ncbi:hypothetical protein FOL47_004271 [Perkinsus chesapeaki]|uniref:Tail specific protease domain-containing protein n=1 Tax=Perkinsus chesapeaki TaxID=330153 RepID=A0A7J6M3J1_PERCH|nr:hypothetical protein FOL47_004271 [Perkinsus chesapeaki]
MFYKPGFAAVCHGSNPPIRCGPANISSGPTSQPPPVDECLKLSESAVWQPLDDDPDKDYMWAKMEDVNRCLSLLTTTNFNALFTLHNLKYGVAETYAFADLVNGLNNSIESNNCGFKKHSLNVDIKSFIDNKIERIASELDKLSDAEQMAFLRESLPAVPFHLELLKELNRLNDGHTQYFTPFQDFFYVLPIRFESTMRGGSQIVTITIMESINARHLAVYGEPATSHRNGDVITTVDGKPVLEWMLEMVFDDGPYIGPLNVTFADGTTESINWVGRVSNYTKMAGSGAISWQFYNTITNRNPQFRKMLAFETEFYSKVNDTLWALAVDGLSTEGFDVSVLDSAIERSMQQQQQQPSTLLLSLADSRAIATDENKWIGAPGYQYSLLDDTVIVYVPDFVPTENVSSPDIFFASFPQVQDFARKYNATRLLFDMSSNPGGFATSTFALEWYLLSDVDDVCPTTVQHMTANWQSWVESFGVNFNSTVEEFFEEHPGLVEDPGFIHERFQQLYLLYNYADQLFPDIPAEYRVETRWVARVKEIEEAILSEKNATLRASAFKSFLLRRGFGGPSQGWFLFDNDEVLDRETRKPFSPPLSQFTNARPRPWGKLANYSREGTWGFCYEDVDNVTSLLANTTYDRDYWTDIAFVSNGDCSSGCSVFTETLQVTGKATAFTYGALADQAMDVGSAGSANVLDYSGNSATINYASHLGYWATFGQAEWAKKRTNSWVNKPIPFPNPAAAVYSWYILLQHRLGPDALPRQFYRIPPHKHINMWGRTLEERAPIHEEIVRYKNWTELRSNPQFPDLGYCPAYGERRPSLETPNQSSLAERSGTFLVVIIGLVVQFCRLS